MAIKWVRADKTEASIARMLSHPERLEDPTNHCIPILDFFTDDVDSDIGFLVMPLLRRFNDPPFFYVDEVVDFMRQTLEVRLIVR